MKNEKFPKTVTVGSTTLKVYHTPTKGYDSYTVLYYDANRQQRRRTFADPETAEQEARVIAGQLARGEQKPCAVGDRTRYMLERALEHLRPTGVPLDEAAAQFAAALKHLNNATIVEAAKFYAERHGDQIKPKTVGEIVDEVLAIKEQKGRAPLYVKDLRLRLKPFAEAFVCPLNDVSRTDIEKFLAARDVAGRTRNNFLRNIGTLCRFAKARKYVSKDHDGIAGIERDTVVGGDIAIFTPDEIRVLLESASAEVVCAVAVGAFAGLRSEEIKRLEWSDIDFGKKHIQVQAKNAKTRSRRLIPLRANLRAWLLPYRQASGPITAYLNLGNAFMKLATTAGVAWKRNGLRHSFVSYRMAETNNENTVALEAGNSPKMIFANYRAVVDKRAAKEWFKVKPKRATNVVALTGSRCVKAA
jgi:integrase